MITKSRIVFLTVLIHVICQFTLAEPTDCQAPNQSVGGSCECGNCDNDANIDPFCVKFQNESILYWNRCMANVDSCKKNKKFEEDEIQHCSYHFKTYCPDNNRKKDADGRAFCECRDCSTADKSSVCGSFGSGTERYYFNECFMQKAACMIKTNIVKEDDSKCDGKTKCEDCSELALCQPTKTGIISCVCPDCKSAKKQEVCNIEGIVFDSICELNHQNCMDGKPAATPVDCKDTKPCKKCDGSCSATKEKKMVCDVSAGKSEKGSSMIIYIIIAVLCVFVVSAVVTVIVVMKRKKVAKKPGKKPKKSTKTDVLKSKTKAVLPSKSGSKSGSAQEVKSN